MAKVETSPGSETIRLNYFSEPTMDFFGLRNRAIAQIQKLASENWTDYNEHDPGVTIVEQLCYAITDLSYRTSFPVQDLLAEKPEYNGEGKDSFVLAPEILPCHPQTIDDWRILFIDQIQDIENIWMEPVPVSATGPGLLYKISIQLKNTVTTGVNVLAEVKKLFYRYRNLGEDIGAIKILDEYKVQINAIIGIDGKESTEEILASVFYNLYRELSPGIIRYTYQELIRKGYSIEEIFNTPSFSKGFILTEELFPKTITINTSDLINAVRTVAGVDNVVSFEVVNSLRDLKTLQIKPNEVAVLDTDFSKQKIVLTYNKVPVAVNMNQVKLLFYHKLNSELNWLTILQNQTEIKKLKVPSGINRDVAFYRSVQFTFPSVYGLGKNISSPFEDRQTINQELQLKGYLLIFDQVLANYLAQLSSLAELFSIDSKISHTYFTQVPAEVPQIKELVGNLKGSWGDDWKDSYEHDLKEIIESVDDFNLRRNLFLDHLLSRFGVDMDEIAPEILNWYMLPKDEYEKFIIQLKCLSLLKIATFTRDRSMAADIQKPNSISIYEQIVMVQLGIASADNRIRETYSSLADPVFSSHIAAGNNPERHWHKNIPVRSENAAVQSQQEEYATVISTFNYKKIVEMLKQGLLYISVEMLAGGFVKENYIVEEDEGFYSIVYLNDPDPWDGSTLETANSIEVGRFGTREEAKSLISEIALFIRNLNLRCEGFHLVEHILLRNSKPAKLYYVEFIDHRNKVLLISLDAVAESERENLAKEIIHAGRYHFSVNLNYDYKTQEWSYFLIGKKNKPIAKSFYQYKNRHELNHALKELETYFDFTEPEERFIKTHCRWLNSNPEENIPESFYSFRMTAVFPSWPSRFRNEFYQSRIKYFVRAMAPAQLGIYIVYLDPHEMRSFEILYMKWRNELAIDPHSEQTKEMAYSLSVFLNEKDKNLI